MKVLIISCSNPEWWYADKVGEQFDAEEYNKDAWYARRTPDEERKYGRGPTELDYNTNEYYYGLVSGGFIRVLKSDCHIIQPAWEVMKEAEETGREVEQWDNSEKKWTDLRYWNPDSIYRLKPEPPQPEYVPYEGEELAALVDNKVVVRAKGYKSRYVVMGYFEEDETVNLGNKMWVDGQDLLNNYEHLNFTPCGKLK